MTDLQTITASLRAAVDAGDLGRISNGVETLERLSEEGGRTIKLPPLYLDQNEALRFVMTNDGYFHAAWEIGEAVLVIEHVPINYPALTLATFESFAAYEASVKDVLWIVDDVDEESEDGGQTDHLATPEFLEEMRKMT